MYIHVHLLQYKPDGFTEFDNLVHMNASNSRLPMGESMYTCTYTCTYYSGCNVTVCNMSFSAEAFKTFPALEQLDLLVCGITDISLSDKDFTKLQVSLCTSMHVRHHIHVHMYLISVVYTCTCTCTCTHLAIVCVYVQFLDLSYNCVSEMAVLTLGTLPRLTELHLTGDYNTAS